MTKLKLNLENSELSTEQCEWIDQRRHWSARGIRDKRADQKLSPYLGVWRCPGSAERCEHIKKSNWWHISSGKSRKPSPQIRGWLTRFHHNDWYCRNHNNLVGTCEDQVVSDGQISKKGQQCATLQIELEISVIEKTCCGDVKEYVRENRIGNLLMNSGTSLKGRGCLNQHLKDFLAYFLDSIWKMKDWKEMGRTLILESGKPKS